MRAVLVIVFLFQAYRIIMAEVTVTSRYQVTETIDEGLEGEEVMWMLLPDGRGNLQVAVLRGLEPPDTDSDSINSLQFFLYTRDNPTIPERRVWNTSCLPVFEYFKPERKTKVLIHGFGDGSNGSIMYPLMRKAFLSVGDYNVLEVDWSKLAATPWYVTAARNTDRVGLRVAAMLDHLVSSTGAKPSRFHILGFSLGAHVAGAAGRSMKTGSLGRITGLDPAQVLFTSTPPEYRLDPTDARLVEIVHTSGGYLGFGVPIGHRDFFPNGGSWPQPGCPFDYAAVCSHRRAYYFYAEGVKTGRGFLATPCDTYPSYEAGLCDSNRDNALEMVNYDWNTKLVGKYFLDTNTQEPYGMIKDNETNQV